MNGQPRPTFLEASDLGTQAQWSETWRSQLAHASEATEAEVRKACGHPTQNPHPETPR